MWDPKWGPGEGEMGSKNLASHRNGKRVQKKNVAETLSNQTLTPPRMIQEIPTMSRKQIKNIRKTWTLPQNTHTTFKVELRVPPPTDQCHKKTPEGAQRQPRQAKGTQKSRTRTPRTPQMIPEVPKRHPKVTPGPPKSEPKVNLGRTKKGVWKCLEIGVLNSLELSSHAGKTAIL